MVRVGLFGSRLFGWRWFVWLTLVYLVRVGLFGSRLFGWRWFVWFTFVYLVRVAAVEGERAHLQDDLAFCFVHSDGAKRLWLGKLQQMRSKTGTRTHNVHHSIDLCDPPEDLRMQCQWYHETRKGSGKYVPSAGTVNIDKKFVHVSSCLGLVDLVWSNNVYTMKDNGQMESCLLYTSPSPRH